LPEQVNTYELGLEFGYIPGKDFPFVRISGHFNVFNNGYINKLTYKYAPGQPPTPYNTLAASLSGVEISSRFHLRDDRGFLTLGSTFLDLSNPLVFVGKPAYRHTLGVSLKHGALHYSAGMWWNGRTIYLYDDGYFQEPRHDLDVALDYQYTLHHVLITSTLSAKNLLNLHATRSSLLINDQGYLMTYFDEFQLVLRIQLSLH
jgi:outer membrane receptor protein involved in Fe transport